MVRLTRAFDATSDSPKEHGEFPFDLFQSEVVDRWWHPRSGQAMLFEDRATHHDDSDEGFNISRAPNSSKKHEAV